MDVDLDEDMWQVVCNYDERDDVTVVYMSRNGRPHKNLSFIHTADRPAGQPAAMLDSNSASTPNGVAVLHRQTEPRRGRLGSWLCGCVFPAALDGEQYESATTKSPSVTKLGLHNIEVDVDTETSTTADSSPTKEPEKPKILTPRLFAGGADPTQRALSRQRTSEQMRISTSLRRQSFEPNDAPDEVETDSAVTPATPLPAAAPAPDVSP